MREDDFQPPEPTAAPLPAADVQAPTGPAPALVQQAFPVRQAEDDINEFFVQVRASTLKRCRSGLGDIAHSRFPWHEVALAIASSAYGAFLGALPADLNPGSRSAVFFYTILPVLGTGSLVAFYFLRRASTVDAAQRANQLLEDLPDPDRTR